jgi:hypothetical protein
MPPRVTRVQNVASMPSSRPHLPGRVPCSLCRCGRCAAPDACLLPRLALCPLQLPPTPLTASADADAMDGRAELAAAAVASAAPPLPPLQCLATPRTHHQNPSCQAHRCRRAVALLASSPWSRRGHDTTLPPPIPPPTGPSRRSRPCRARHLQCSARSREEEEDEGQRRIRKLFSASSCEVHDSYEQYQTVQAELGLIPRNSRGLEAKVLFFFGLIFFFLQKKG